MTDWTTAAGLKAIRLARSAAIPGWRDPLTYAVGYRDQGEWVFPYINELHGIHVLPAVVLAEIVGHSSGDREYALSREQLAAAIANLAPAEAATDIEHPNLAAWRATAAADASVIAAVFIESLDAPISGDAEQALRRQLTL
ncbi:MAG: hypothetical protein LLG14_21210 [Nocardiaceae bacterium]|nr:hypothetical protein [Nocardiaceae bacterium]